MTKTKEFIQENKTEEGANQPGGDQEEARLEDILKSIRGMVDDHNPSSNFDEDCVDSQNEDIKLNHTEQKFENKSRQMAQNNFPDNAKAVEVKETKESNILELTSVISSEQILRNRKEQIRAKFSSLSGRLKKLGQNSSSKSIDPLMNNLIKPMVQDWLDKNLENLVERIIIEELNKKNTV